jgi:preprotein translocase subunit SecD
VRYLLFALALLITLPAHAGQSPPQLLLRIHVQTTGSGMSETQARTVLLPPNGEPIQVRALPEVSERNLINVEQRSNGTLLFFDHEGQINLSAVTAQNQGRILVVFLNGYIIYAPVIDEQITDGQLLLPHPLAPQIVTILQQMAAKNLRQELKE